MRRIKSAEDVPGREFRRAVWSTTGVDPNSKPPVARPHPRAPGEDTQRSKASQFGDLRERERERERDSGLHPLSR